MEDTFDWYAQDADGNIWYLGEDTAEFEDVNPLEPDVAEHKYYARGIGPVLAEMTAGGSDREELLEVTTVDARSARLAGTTPLGEAYP